ncbi:MAG: DUF2169 domain-containing protein [Polyangiaceae bacterium]|nr:DUF2169 domain-containing protein [Polyangiaceae bacterium]
MEVVSHSPLPVASQLWQTRPGSWVLTFVAKVTFDLQPGKAQLAADQEPIHEHDCYWDDDPARSVYAPSDLAPLKTRADVLLVGSAYAPKGQAVRSLFARLIVGDLDKSIEVHLDRVFGPDGSLIEGSRFSRMSLSYERAAGGPETMNPIGVRLDVRDMHGRIKIPNLQPPGMNVHAPGVAILPVGFGPIAATWPIRANRLGRYASTWSSFSLAATPLPDDLDRSFFNSAPLDQQLVDIAEDARIVMENMHPEWPRLVTNLPGLRPRAVLEGRGGIHPLKMRADTLWIDTDRAIACLTFRSHRSLERYDEPGRISITLEEAMASVAPPSPSPIQHTRPSIELPLPKKSKATTLIPNSPEEQAIKESLRQAGALPFLPASTPAAPSREERPAMAGGLPFGNVKPAGGHAIADERTSSGGGLPFVQPTPPRAPATNAPPPPPPRGAPPGWPVSGAGAPPPPVPSPVPPVPPAVVSPLPAAPPPLPAVVVPPVPPPVPPPRASQQGTAARQDDSVWGSGLSRGGEAPAAQSIGQVVVAAASAAAHVAPQDAASGVLGASNAAAGPSQSSTGKREEVRASAATAIANSGVRASSRLDAREVLHLVWYHADSVARICKVPVWRAILQEMEQKPADDDLDDPAPNRDPIEIEDMRDIFEILARAASEDVAELADELTAAVRPGNKFVPPLLLLAGEVSFPFDERETLKAAVAIATPLATTDEPFKNAVREAKEFLAGGADQMCPGPLAESHTARIREAFQRSRRSVPADTLDLQIERALLEGRHYQKRQVLGMNAIRALMHTTTGNSNVRPAPIYIPDDIAKKLPLFQRFRTRIIVELYFQEDQYEAHPAALKALAIGRVQQYPEQKK